jgi:hypothetical protein
MSAINKIPRGLRVLIVMAILAILVWRFTEGNSFYIGIGIAVVLTLVVIIFVYKPAKTNTLKANQIKKKIKAVEGQESIIPDQTLESGDDITYQQPNKTNDLVYKSTEVKPKGTDVAAMYMNMAKNVPVSDKWQASPKQTPFTEDISENDIKVEISLENNIESPLPLIDDETSLTIEEKNQLVNAVWYRCENPFCKFTRFLSVHQIIKEKNGGTNKLDNLIVLCPYCHDLAHRQEIPEKEMRDWISNREDRFKFKPEWHY